MAFFKARTRKPSIQPSAVDSTPVVPQAQARSGLPSATPTSRISHIFSIPPSPGMLGILITDGVQMTIEYLREIPYTGQLPVQSPAIVKPVPKFRVGNQLPLFVDGRHFIALIKEVEPHTHILSEDVPRIGTQIFDFPSPATEETHFLDIHPPKPSVSPQNGLGLLPIPEVSGTRSTMYPTPPPDAPTAPASSRRESMMTSTRTRAKTLSTAALNISQTDQEAFRRVHDRFFATNPSLTQIKPTPPAEGALQFPSSPRHPAVPHSQLQDEDIPLTSTCTPSLAPRHQQNVMSWFGRARTASDVDENRITQPWHRRNLRPSGSSNTVAMPSTITTVPRPRLRLHSDSGPTQPRSNGTLARSSTVLGQGRAQSQAHGRSQWTIRKPVPRVSQILDGDQPVSKGSNFFKFGTAKAKAPLWSTDPSVPNKGMAGAQAATTMTTEGLLRGALIDGGLLYPDNAPSIPMPSGLGRKESNGPVDEKEVSWVSLLCLQPESQTSFPSGRAELILDPLSTREQKLRDRKPSLQATTESFLRDNQRRKRSGFELMPTSPHDGRGVQSFRVPTASPGPSTMSSFPNSQSRAESRRNSSRKELPPIPISGPILYSPQSLLRSQIKEEKANESECRKGQSKEKSLGHALDLTPPLSRVGSITSNFHAFTPAPPSCSLVEPCQTYQLPPTEPLLPGSPLIPDARLTTFQASRTTKGKERMKYDATPTPLEQMRARRPYGSILSFTTHTAHDVVSHSTSGPETEAPPNESTSTVSAGGTRQVYETAPSSVDELGGCIDEL